MLDRTVDSFLCPIQDRRAMPSADTKLIDLIYAAPSAGWMPALEGMQAAFRGGHVILGVHSGPAPAIDSCGVDPAHLAVVMAPEAQRIAFRQPSRMPINVAFVNTDLMPESE